MNTSHRRWGWFEGTKIIGHRGAAGLALENTARSITIARELGVHGIEFDVRKTKDGFLVLCHDADLVAMANKSIRIRDTNLEELQDIPLVDGSKIITLKQALKLVGNCHVVIELKESGCIEELLGDIDGFDSSKITVASFRHREVALLKNQRPDIKVYLAEHTKAFDIIHLARGTKADGLDLNFWLLNPLTYFLARRGKLEIMVYTVNNPFIGWFIQKLYPGTMLCTDHPQRFIQPDLRSK